MLVKKQEGFYSDQTYGMPELMNLQQAESKSFINTANTG